MITCSACGGVEPFCRVCGGSGGISTNLPGLKTAHATDLKRQPRLQKSLLAWVVLLAMLVSAGIFAKIAWRLFWWGWGLIP